MRKRRAYHQQFGSGGLLSRPRTAREADCGDFDDIGRGSLAGAYRYQQKRRKGVF